LDWDDFKFVQAIAQTGSVRGAGELLRVHGSTVARRLEQLERRIGTRLFTRSSAGMDITPAGAEVIDALNRVASDLDSVERRLSDRSSTAVGSVVLAAAPGLIGTVLIPYLTALMGEHPELELRLSDGQALERLHSGEADAALWITDDPARRPHRQIPGHGNGLRVHEPGPDGRSAPPSSRCAGGHSLDRRCRTFIGISIGIAIDGGASPIFP
jgi:DNA-binding transcriptional LysR family regulator